MSESFGKPTDNIIEFILVFVISGCLWGSILETRGNNKNKIKGFFRLLFWGGVREGFGMLFGCFLDAFWMLFGSLLVAFWEPLGTGLLELLGSCGKDLGCFFVFVD